MVSIDADFGSLKPCLPNYLNCYPLIGQSLNFSADRQWRGKTGAALEAVMDLEDRVFHPILDECLPQAVSV